MNENYLIKVAADSFVSAFAEEGFDIPAEDVYDWMKEAGIGTSLIGGITRGVGAIKNFGANLGQRVGQGLNRAGGFIKNEVGHLQGAIGNRMAQNNATASIHSYLPSDQLRTIKQGLGGTLDYAKGALQRASPNLSTKVTNFAKDVKNNAQLVTPASPTAAVAGDIAQRGVSNQISHGITGYMGANHPILSGIVGHGVNSVVQGATNVGNRLMTGMQQIPSRLGFGKSASMDFNEYVKEAMYAELENMGEELGQVIFKLAVSEQDAERALDRYDNLQRNKLTTGQVGRYAGIGAVAGVGSTALGNLIKGGPGSLSTKLTDARAPGVGGMVRGLASSAVKGAIAGGAVPIIRQRFDRRAELGTLKKYIDENNVKMGAVKKVREKDSALFGTTPAVPYNATESAMLAKEGGMALTPKGRLAATRRVGLPRVSPAPGPSIAQQSSTFGPPMPGNVKNGIGKGFRLRAETEGGMQIGDKIPA